jgi:hypothetical protein
VAQVRQDGEHPLVECLGGAGMRVQAQPHLR